MSLHRHVRVPLEGTALILGIIGVAAAATLTWMLGEIGFTHPGLSIETGALGRLEPRGLLFSFWGWATSIHPAATLLIELGLWPLIGVAIARTVIVRVTDNDPTGVRTALGFALRHLSKSLAFVGLICCTLVILASPYVLPTVASLIPGIGESVGPVLFVICGPAMFFFAFVGIFVVLAGFPAGYLFMPAAVAAKEGPFFDCASRSIGYAFSRPFLFTWDAFKIGLFAYLVYALGTKGLVWLIKDLPTLFGLMPSLVETSAVAGEVQWIIVTLVRILTGGFVAAYVFGAGTLAYLNLRFEVDGIPYGGPNAGTPEPGAEA